MKGESGAPLRYPDQRPPSEGEAREVAPGILWMRLPLPMALDHVNVYALDDGDGWTLVDTGMDTRRTRAIWQGLVDGPLSGMPVRRVIVTHHHPDHVGLAGWFQAERGAELAITRTAWLTARMLTLDEQVRPADETLEYWRSAGMAEDVFRKRREERPFNFIDMVAPMPLGFRRIREGDRITAGGRVWFARMGDGHAPEHATLWSEAGDVVIGGDQLLASISPNLGVYATEPEADPVGEWLDSCERLSAHALDAQLVLPGHKLPFTGLPVRMRQLTDHHRAALDRLLDLLGEPRSAAQCFPALFKREIGEGEYGLALAESVAHLNHLLQSGLVSRRRRDDGAWLWRRA